MNIDWYDPQGWLDLLDHAWYGLVLIAVAAIPSWLSIRTNRSLREVSDSVNNRPTALRDDLDRVIKAVEALAHDVRGIRTDLQLEEDRRRRDVAELENRIGRHRKQED